MQQKNAEKNKSNYVYITESDKFKPLYDEKILEMKREIINKDEIVKVLDTKCKSLEAKVKEQTKKYDTLTKVCREILNDLKKSKAPCFETRESDINASKKSEIKTSVDDKSATSTKATNRSKK